jgi:hypothetical protein
LTACLESLTNLVKLKSVTFIKIIGVLLWLTNSLQI